MAKRRAYSNSRSAIISLLIEHRTLSRMEISRLTGLSRAAISLSANELVAEGVIQEIGVAASTGGRRAVMLRLGGATRLVAGAAFEGDTCHVSLVNLDGQQLDRIAIEHAGPRTPEAAIDLTARAVTTLMADREPDALIGCGLAFTGQMHASTDTFSSIGWAFTAYPLRQQLSRRLRVPVEVMDNAHAAGLGELWLLGREHRSHLVYVYAGNGVGGAIIADRELHPGRDHAAGEFGQLLLDPNGPDFPCGHRGCLEGYLSHDYLLAILDDARQTGIVTAIPPDVREADFATVVALAEANGDPGAILIMEHAARWLGLAIANLITIFNPDDVVIGGPVARWGERFSDLIRMHASRLTAPHTFAGVTIRPGCPIVEAVTLGAAASIINRAPDLLTPTARELADGRGGR
ncbi:MAG: ROK family transcriptional regulator [Thermomicrobiales bacterium]